MEYCLDDWMAEKTVASTVDWMGKRMAEKTADVLGKQMVAD